MPRVSLIIPVYNTAEYLERCFASISAQTLAEIEIIAVDDGSTDSSWSVIENWRKRDSRFAKSFRTPHSGMSNARNMGLAEARGEFVAFIDSDDFIEARYCEYPYTVATQANADVVMFGSYWETADKRDTNLPIQKNGMSPQQMLVHATSTVWDKHFRRSFLNAFGFQFIELYHEDLLAIPQILAQSPRSIVLDQALYHYIRRADSVCGLKVNPRTADGLKIFERLMKLSDSNPSFRDAVRYCAFRNLRVTMAQWAECNEPWAIECLEKARALLTPLARLERANIYLNPPVSVGKRIERACRVPFCKLRKALGLR